MEIKETIGIDVSKATLDACIHSSQRPATFENSKKGFSLLMEWAYKGSPHPRANILFVFEHTGLYSEKLSEHLSERNVPYAIVPGLEIKRSLGIARGKDDRIDASKIALYAYRLRDEIKLSTIPLKEIKTLKKLLSLRERLVRQRAGYRTSVKEQKRVLEHKEAKLLLKVQSKVIKELSKQIDIVENEMQSIIGSNMELAGMFDLLLSIRWVYRQTGRPFPYCLHRRLQKVQEREKICGLLRCRPFPQPIGNKSQGQVKGESPCKQEDEELIGHVRQILYSPQYGNKGILPEKGGSGKEQDEHDQHYQEQTAVKGIRRNPSRDTIR